MKWKIEKTCRKGEAPRARSGHRIVYYNGQIFTFGGYNPESTAEQLFKELWKFNLITKTWQSIKITGDIPNTLASHTGKSFSEALIFTSLNPNHNMITDCSWNYRENYKRRTDPTHVLPMFSW